MLRPLDRLFYSRSEINTPSGNILVEPTVYPSEGIDNFAMRLSNQLDGRMIHPSTNLKEEDYHDGK